MTEGLYDSYIIVVTNVENDETHFYGVWEPKLPDHDPSQRKTMLYRHAHPNLAILLNSVGSGEAIAHIELTIA